MRFDEDSQAFVIDDDTALPAKFFIKESTPVHGDFPGWADTHEARVMRCTFENRWSLSIIWGSMTYGTNKDHPAGSWSCPAHERTVPVFVEEPDHVEVGIILPEPFTRPAVKLDDIPNWRGPAELPAHEVELWGDPLGWVDAPQLKWLIGIVSRFNSHSWMIPTEGPYIETDDDGRYRLRVEFEESSETITTDTREEQP